MDCSYLTKLNVLLFFFHVTSTHIFCLALSKQKIKLLVLDFFINKTDRQTDRQAGRWQTDRQLSSVLYNLMQMEVFFFIKTHLASVYGDCNE